MEQCHISRIFSFPFFLPFYKLLRDLFSLKHLNSLLKSFVKITLTQMIAIWILFYYNDVSMLLASFVEECDRLKNVFVHLQYPLSLVDSIISRFVQKQYEEVKKESTNQQECMVRLCWLYMSTPTSTHWWTQGVSGWNPYAWTSWREHITDWKLLFNTTQVSREVRVPSLRDALH